MWPSVKGSVWGLTSVLVPSRRGPPGGSWVWTGRSVSGSRTSRWEGAQLENTRIVIQKYWCHEIGRRYTKETDRKASKMTAVLTGRQTQQIGL